MAITTLIIAHFIAKGIVFYGNELAKTIKSSKKGGKNHGK